MKPNIFNIKATLRVLCAIITITVASAQDIRFIPLTLDNTSLANGSPLPKDSAWKWLPNASNQAVLESSGDPSNITTPLLITAKGLEAGRDYEVFGYFLADVAQEEEGGAKKRGPVQLGLTLATMYPFGGERSDALVAKEPWVITPRYKTGEAYGYSSTLETDEPLLEKDAVPEPPAGTRLVRARLGFSRAGKDGTLPVFFHGYSSYYSKGNASFVGVALRVANPDVVKDVVWKAGTRLHLAIRAGDSVTMRRELEAGADVNALDEENLTPLFYATACGDAALVRSLLDLGALTDQEGQAVSPLVAAASDAELTRTLLDAGAKVPTKPAMDKGRLSHEIDPWLLHPVIAAIRSGSVPVLKQLLAANPAIHLKDIATEWERINISLARSVNDKYFVGSSMLRENWDMAVFLIENEYPIMAGDIHHFTKSDGIMLSRAVMAGPAAMPVVEAMLRRGESPVVGTSTDRYHRDALTMAAWRGNVALVRRFLPFAKDVSPYYPSWLLEHALYSENQEIIDLVRNRFPDAVVKRWQAPVDHVEGADQEVNARSFLPRTSPPPQTTAEGRSGKHVLAVIASPEASAAGDILSAFASGAEGWQVVEREKIEAALKEDAFSKPWLNGEHRLANLGDRLSADCLIVVSPIRNGKEVIYRYEVVEVATGLEIHREHFKDGAFVDSKEIADFLYRACRALDSAGRNERHQAITLLTFTAQGLRDPLAMSGILEASVRYEVDSTPGLISLSRAQSSRLLEEQVLQGKNSVWGTAHMIEGSVAAAGENKIKVSLRIESYKDGKTTKTDVDAVGETSSLSATTAIAWQKLMVAINQPLVTPTEKSDATKLALNEGRRLLREAEWLHALDAAPESYIPMIESAIALGVPPRETIMLHLDAYYCLLWPVKKDRDGQTEGNPTSRLQNVRDVQRSVPTSLELSDQLAHSLSVARRFLHQTSWYLEREGSELFTMPIDVWNAYGPFKTNESWYAIQALCNIRSLIYRLQLTENQRIEFDAFSAELDSLTQRYFSLLKVVPDPDFYRYYIQVADFRFYERNPAIGEGLVEMASSGASLNVLLNLNTSRDPDTSEEAAYNEGLMEIRKLLAKKMIARIGEGSSTLMKLAKADLECFLAEHSQRPLAIRRLVESFAEARNQTVPTRQKSGAYLLSQIILDSYTTSILFDWDKKIIALDNEAFMLPSVLFLNKAAPDSLIRFNTYHKVFHMLSQRGAWKQVTSNPNLDAFRERIDAYHPWEHSRLKAETVNGSKINGSPSQSGTSSYGGPPGFFAPTKSSHDLLKSSPLISQLYGSGKKAVKAEKQSQAPVNKPTPKSLTATLLADLRTDNSPGTMVWPLVDIANPDLLWIFYFPSSSDGFHVNAAGGSGLQILENDCKAPWLLGIDCSSGKIVKKINLHSAVGEAYSMDLSDRKCGIWEMVFDQTRSRILTNVGWFDKNYASNKMGSVIIDKDTGKAHPLPGNPEIPEGKGSVFFDIWETRIGVVGIGEHFFYLNRASSRNGSAVEESRSDSLAIFEVSPDLTVKPLSVIGRKPELTPFDSADRSPLLITDQDGQLRVVHESTIAHFEPEKREWSIVAGSSSRKPVKADVTAATDVQYWKFLQSIHDLRIDGKSTGWMAVGWNHRPGFLPFASREKGIQQFQISAEIPDDFLTKTYAIDTKDSTKSGKPNEVRTLFKDHPRSKKYNMVVLAQTEADLILGIQTGDYYEWNRPSRNASHLPFLWKISKKEILEQLDGEASR